MKNRIAFVLAIIVLLSALLMLCSCEEQRSVRTVEINEKGELIIIFSDGTSSNVGPVKGADGADGENGEDGENGRDGLNGAKGDKGDTGDKGLTGKDGIDGSSIDNITLEENGTLFITYTDGTSDSLDLNSGLCLFEGMCGESAKWALYNGGVLVISGSGKTYDYDAGKTPWYPVISLISAVFVDTTEITEGKNLLFGIDENIISRAPENAVARWVDMTVEAPLYASADTSSEVIARLPLGTKLYVTSEDAVAGWSTVIYNGTTAFMEYKYAKRTDNLSVVYTPCKSYVKVTKGAGAALRTFPDATSASTGNTYATVPQGALLSCTGVSLNGNWYRVSYEGQTLYAHNSWIEEVST